MARRRAHMSADSRMIIFQGRIIVTVLAWIFGLCSVALSDDGNRVENKEFGFSVVVPDGALSCVWSSGGHPHGFSVFLYPDKLGCQTKNPQPYVGIFGNYNVLFYMTPMQSLTLLCSIDTISEASSNTLNVSFQNRLSAVCREDEKNGWINIYVAAQSQICPDNKSAANSKMKEPCIDYTAHLHTRPETFAEDLEIFRAILTTVHLPESDRNTTTDNGN